MNLKKYSALFGALALVFGSGSVSAAIVAAPTGTVDISTAEMSKDFNYTVMSTVTENPDGTSLNFMGNDMNSVWNYDWNIDADADPFIDATLTFKNMTASTQSFAITLNLPVTPAFSPGLKIGNLGFSFTDTGGSAGASVANVSWNGLIDGSTAMTLFGGSFSCGGAGCSFTSSPVSDGPLPHPGGVSNSIGILLGFDLSAGDTATFNTRFEVTPVPIPAAIWLFGSGLLGLVGIARRKKSV